MYRLEGSVGETTRLVQRTTAPTVSIRFQDGTIVVNSEPTIQIGSLSIRFYDFTPPAQGAYLIRWNGAQPEQEWEVMDVTLNSLRWLVSRIKDRTDGLPPAEMG